jgi:hypothetical protein
MRFLKPEEIEVRVGATSTNKPKAMLLLYKDARCDMAVLDETYGAENWQDKYEKIDSVLFCAIGVYNKTIKEWVWKQSNGIESQGTGDDDPNNKKGEASDAFKRAGFMWGIGRELYEWKDLWIDYDKQKDKYERFRVTKIGYDGNGQPKDLIIVNSKNKIVYKLENGYFKKDKGEVEEEPTEEIKNAPEPQETPETKETKQVVNRETVANEVKQENVIIWRELIKIAQEIYQNEGFVENIAELAKKAPLDYFEDLKIPFAKLELTKIDREPKIKGNVVVVLDEERLTDYKGYVFSSAEMPF